MNGTSRAIDFSFSPASRCQSCLVGGARGWLGGWERKFMVLVTVLLFRESEVQYLPERERLLKLNKGVDKWGVSDFIKIFSSSYPPVVVLVVF